MYHKTAKSEVTEFTSVWTEIVCRTANVVSLTLVEDSGTHFPPELDSLSKPLSLNQNLKLTFSKHSCDWCVCVCLCACVRACVCACLRAFVRPGLH